MDSSNQQIIEKEKKNLKYTLFHHGEAVMQISPGEGLIARMLYCNLIVQEEILKQLESK